MNDYTKKNLSFGGKESIQNPFSNSMEIDPREHDMSRYGMENDFVKPNSAVKLYIPPNLVPEGKIWAFLTEYINNQYQRDLISEKLRLGWRFVNAEKVPQFHSIDLSDEVKYPTMDYRYVRVKGTILSEIDEKVYQARQQQFRQLANRHNVPFPEIFRRNSGIEEGKYTFIKEKTESTPQKIVYS